MLPSVRFHKSGQRECHSEPAPGSGLLSAEVVGPAAHRLLPKLLSRSGKNRAGNTWRGRNPCQNALSVSVAAPYADGPAYRSGSIRSGNGCYAVRRIGTNPRWAGNEMAGPLSSSRCTFPAASAGSLRHLAELSRTEAFFVCAAGCASGKRFFPDRFSELTD